MSLSPGTRLGPYEIVGPIGAGGMGEVHKARDTRLDRDVAIKVLSARFTSDDDFKVRLEREARTVAQLDHPHICSLFDVGQSDSSFYLVMPLLDGETLAARLSRGKLPFNEAITIAAQVADALDAAHRLGIVHRDVKPGNIMLTRGGPQPIHARLLDFGLARKSDGPADPVAPTVGLADTARGHGIVGTIPYMAPEQIEGRAIDARTDIFALGTVIYEMIAGARPFEGKTSPLVMAAILEHQPAPLSTTHVSLPSSLDHVISRCLAKDLDERWSSARDLSFELQWIQAESRRGSRASVARASRSTLAAAVAATLVIAAVTGVAAWRWSAPSVIPLTTRLSFTAHDAPDFALVGLNPGIAISSNGRVVVYPASRSAHSEGLVVRNLDSFDSRILAGTEDGGMPFFSPDDSWLGFLQNGVMKKAPTEGGPVVGIHDLPKLTTMGSPAWIDDDTILMGVDNELIAIDANGGPLHVVARFNGGSSVGDVAPLPDKRHALLAVVEKNATANQGQIVVVDLQSGSHTALLTGYAPRFADGFIVFVKDTQLWATRFDPERRITLGNEWPVPETPATSVGFGRFVGSISGNGTLTYLSAPIEPARRLVWVTRTGEVTPAMTFEKPFQHPRLSPSGDRVVVATRTPNDVWVGDFARDTLFQLAATEWEEESPVWYPDGKRIAFAATRNARRITAVKNADGSGEEQDLWESPKRAHHHLGGWSPDGQHLTFIIGSDINLLATAGGVESSVLVKSAGDPRAASFSPDGSAIAYSSVAAIKGAREQIYVRPFPGPGDPRQVSTDGGSEPAWSHDGRELFYRNADKMMAVDVSLSPSFAARTPRVLFEGKFERIGWRERNYDVSPDGKRFLMVVAVAPPPPPEIRVIINWTEELKRRAP